MNIGSDSRARELFARIAFASVIFVVTGAPALADHVWQVGACGSGNAEFTTLPADQHRFGFKGNSARAITLNSGPAGSAGGAVLHLYRNDTPRGDFFGNVFEQLAFDLNESKQSNLDVVFCFRRRDGTEYAYGKMLSQFAKLKQTHGWHSYAITAASFPDGRRSAVLQRVDFILRGTAAPTTVILGDTRVIVGHGKVAPSAEDFTPVECEDLTSCD